MAMTFTKVLTSLGPMRTIGPTLLVSTLEEGHNIVLTILLMHLSDLEYIPSFLYYIIITLVEVGCSRKFGTREFCQWMKEQPVDPFESYICEKCVQKY